MISLSRFLCLAAALRCLLLHAAAAETSGLDSRQLEFFERRIRPVLVAECYECHSAEKSRGGLRLDHRDALLEGGDSGALLDFTNPEASLLVQSILHADPDLKMPKNAPQLDARIVGDFVEWIRQGAPDPRTEPPMAGAAEVSSVWEDVFRNRSAWWSFQPLREVSVPPPSLWSAHPVDRFLHAAMRAKGLDPAPPADRRALLRRVTFALTGLPPRKEELDDFMADSSSDALDRVVDRLLASPRFGERWARHWMDLVRYAETHGSEGDPNIPEIWRYRDYLVRAFNEDVGAAQLIREHLAGDLLPEPRWNEADRINESMLGISHLRLVEHGFQPVDTLDEEVKVIDSQIDVISKAFQGLTISCARCHDHKFDPVSQRDYFAMYGVLASVRPAQRTLDRPEDLRRERERLEVLKDTIRDGFADLWSQAATALPELLREIAEHAAHSPEREARQRIERVEAQLTELEQKAGAFLFAPDRTAPLPMAAWTFEEDATDLFGSLPGVFQGGARVKDGRLVLDGKSAFVQTSPLGRTITEKTLEAWVMLPEINQRGGGVLTLETSSGDPFDSIVFGERQPGRWMAGSEFLRRTRDVDGAGEASDRLVHLAIVYRADDTIALFRDGVPYGEPYRPMGDRATLRTYEAGTARVLLGLRHTGAGGGYLKGEIEEARLYDRALSAADIQSSFEGGPIGSGSRNRLREHLRLNEPEIARLQDEREALERDFNHRFPGYPARARARALLKTALEKAGETHPLHLWKQVQKSGSADEQWSQFEEITRAGQSLPEEAAQVRFDAGLTDWFLLGVNPVEQLAPGGFDIAPAGESVVSSIWPAGIFSHRLSRKHNGVLMSPRFQVSTDSISVRILGGGGGRVRLIPDGYPIGSGNIFPQAEMRGETMQWVRLDTAYRKGSWAYLEIAPVGEVLARDRPAIPPDGRSWLGIEAVVFHDGNQALKEPPAFAPLFEGGVPVSLNLLAARYGERLLQAIAHWRSGSLSADEQLFLNAMLRSGLLPNAPASGSALEAEVRAYRELESSVPVPRRAPGVVETAALDAPLMHRGDPHRPLERVPRGSIELLGGSQFTGETSGRLELALELTAPENPLTARVMVNRIWHHLFGRGLVLTVDNFGRLGEAPTHPELLDHLAVRFMEEGWSYKRMIRFLVTSRAFQMSSESSERAREIDPANESLSHMRLRRLEAESIRDSLLAVSGRLEDRMFGPGSPSLAPPEEQRRRSVYLTVRRNNLNPFLEMFDAPKPFSTHGRRDVTNVPGQSLALLNDPLVVYAAKNWVRSILPRDPDPAGRIDRMFEMAFARPPSEAERSLSAGYLAELDADHAGGEEAAWSDFAQALLNFKEFIYVP